MMPLVQARSGFEAKVLTARLGAEGIVWQVRGGLLDSVYPVGQVEILVASDDMERARELLLVDEIEAALDDPDHADAGRAGRSAAEWWLMAGLVVVVGVFLAARMLSLH